MPERDEYRLHENWYTDVHRSVVHSSQKVKTTQMAHQMNGKIKCDPSIQ